MSAWAILLGAGERLLRRLVGCRSRIRGSGAGPGVSQKVLMMEFLKGVPLFRNAPPRALEVAASLMQRRTYPPQAVVFQEGDVGEALYVLSSGQVKLSKIDLAGHEKTLAILQPPEFFGEMALLGDSARSATAVTVGEVEAYLLFFDDFRKLIEEQPVISLNLTAILAQRLRGIDEESQVLSYKDAQGRVAYVLLRLYWAGVIDIAEADRALVRLTHQELANLAGTSRETVTRALKVLGSEGLIETRPGEVLISNPRGLEEVLHDLR